MGIIYGIKMKNKENNRLLHIDILKAIGIRYMIIGHVYGKGTAIDMYLVAFHMPLFFFVTGYLHYEYNIKDFLKRKFNALIVPYLFFGLLNTVFVFIFEQEYGIAKYFRNLFWINNEPPLPVSGALWFLTGLFFACIIFELLYKYLNKKALPFVIILLVSIEYILKFKLPYSIDTAIYMLPIIYLGLMFSKLESSKLYLQKTNRLKLVIYSIFCITLSYFLIFKNGYVNTRMCEFSNIFLFYINALVATIGYFYLSKLATSILKFGILQFIGKNSLEFMCLNQIVLIALIKCGIENKICLFAITIMLLCIIIYLIKKFSFDSIYKNTDIYSRGKNYGK